MLPFLDGVPAPQPLVFGGWWEGRGHDGRSIRGAGRMPTRRRRARRSARTRDFLVGTQGCDASDAGHPTVAKPDHVVVATAEAHHPVGSVPHDLRPPGTQRKTHEFDRLDGSGELVLLQNLKFTEANDALK